MKEKQRKIWISIVFSILCPGLGQMYNGRLVRGIIIAVVPIPYFVYLNYKSDLSFNEIMFLFAASFVYYLLVIIDSVLLVRRTKLLALKQYNNWKFYILFFIILTSVGYIFPIVDSQHITEEFKKTYKTYRVPTGGMLNTIQIGDCLFARMTPDIRSTLKRGDIVIIKSPSDESIVWIKRVIALEHETIEMREDSVFIDGQKIDEPYALYDPNLPKTSEDLRNFGPLKVSPGHLFLMGDNRYNSLDSRNYGEIEVSKVVGLAKVIYWSKHYSRIGTNLN